jgi:hypothetical protein
MYGRGFERGVDYLVKIEWERSMRIHKKNLSKIRNSDGYYLLRHPQSTEIKLKLKKDQKGKHKEFRDMCKLLTFLSFDWYSQWGANQYWKL